MKWLCDLFFSMELIETIKDIFSTIIDKEEKVFIKIVCILLSIVFLLISFRIWDKLSGLF